MIAEQGGQRFGVVTRVARELGIGTESLRGWVKQAEIDCGPPAGHLDGGRGADRAARAGEPGAAPSERHLEGRVGFLRDRARRSTEEVVAFIDAHRGHDSGGLRWGVEPICQVLEIAPSTYYDAKDRPPSRTGRA